MQLIPKETNNIICLSLLRGIPRASLLGHGSLWRQVSSCTILPGRGHPAMCPLFPQECLQLWVPRGSGAAGGAQGELRQVYLFDHRILLASPPDQEGFFHYQTAIKVWGRGQELCHYQHNTSGMLSAQSASVQAKHGGVGLILACGAFQPIATCIYLWVCMYHKPGSQSPFM